MGEYFTAIERIKIFKKNFFPGFFFFLRNQTKKNRIQIMKYFLKGA